MSTLRPAEWPRDITPMRNSMDHKVPKLCNPEFSLYIKIYYVPRIRSRRDLACTGVASDWKDCDERSLSVYNCEEKAGGDGCTFTPGTQGSAFGRYTTM